MHLAGSSADDVEAAVRTAINRGFPVGGVMDALVLITIDLCMVQFYLDLFRKPAAAPATVTQTV